MPMDACTRRKRYIQHVWPSNATRDFRMLTPIALPTGQPPVVLQRPNLLRKHHARWVRASAKMRNPIKRHNDNLTAAMCMIRWRSLAGARAKRLWQ